MLRLKFTAPVSFSYRALALDRIHDIDFDTRQVTATYVLIPSDGSRKRSETITFQVTANQLSDFLNHCLVRVANRVAKLDGVEFPLAGTVEDVPEGTPIP